MIFIEEEKKSEKNVRFYNPVSYPSCGQFSPLLTHVFTIFLIKESYMCSYMYMWDVYTHIFCIVTKGEHHTFFICCDVLFTEKLFLSLFQSRTFRYVTEFNRARGDCYIS